MIEVLTTVIRIRRVSRRLRARVLGVALPGLTIGRRVQIGRHCRLRMESGGVIVLHDGVEVDDGTTLAVSRRGHLEIGADSFIGHHCTLAANEAVSIGSRTYLAELVSVRDHDHDPDLPPSSGQALVTPVRIGDDVWIAAKATVVRGVTIGNRAVVAANAVVRGDVPGGVIVGGIPARVLREVHVGG